MEIVLVSTILVVVVVLLVTEKLPVDVTSLGIIAALMATGLLSPAEALAGFANPAPITIAALLIVSRALVRTGGLDWLADRVISWTRGRPRPLLLLSLVLTGLFSAFINNTPVVVLFISMFLAFCSRHGLAPSKYLLPISFMSILAGTSTLIGTSTNIVISDLGAASGCAPIGMFELSVLGVPLALIGGLYLLLLSDRLLPKHRAPVCEADGRGTPRYISELRLTHDSPWVGRPAVATLRQAYSDLEVYEVIRDERVIDPNTDPVDLAAGDLLLIKASATDLVDLLDRKLARLPSAEGDQLRNPYGDSALIVELIVPPASEVIGLTVQAGVQVADPDLRVIGLRRGLHHFSGQKLAEIRLATGDILLVQCSAGCVSSFRARGELIVMEEVFHSIRVRRRAPLALVGFLVMVGLAASGVVDILVASVVTAFGMILTGCVSIKGAYRSLDVKVLMLLIGAIALGAALQKTGAADMYARAFLAPFAGADPRWVLVGFVFLTSALSHVLSNAAIAVLLVPIALASAASLGTDARPFLIGICFGASACYATPFGYQTNLLVYAPGGYRFTDFVKLGLPLSLLVCVAAGLLVPLIWPF